MNGLPDESNTREIEDLAEIGLTEEEQTEEPDKQTADIVKIFFGQIDKKIDRLDREQEIKLGLELIEAASEEIDYIEKMIQLAVNGQVNLTKPLLKALQLSKEKKSPEQTAAMTKHQIKVDKILQKHHIAKKLWQTLLVIKDETSKEKLAQQKKIIARAIIKQQSLHLKKQQYQQFKENWLFFEKAKAKKIEIRNRLVEANLPLVINLAKKKLHLGLDFLDLINEGVIGSMQGAERWVPQGRYSTYVLWWIKQKIIRALMDKGKNIRRPVHTWEALRALKKTIKKLDRELKRKPLIEELAQETDIPAHKIKRLLDLLLSDPISLACLINESETTELVDVLVDEKAKNPEKEAIKQDLETKVAIILSDLTDKEAAVIRKRYGFDPYDQHTLEEIGQEFRVCRERIRQIEANAFKKLKHPLRVRKIKKILDLDKDADK